MSLLITLGEIVLAYFVGITLLGFALSGESKLARPTKQAPWWVTAALVLPMPVLMLAWGILH